MTYPSQPYYTPGQPYVSAGGPQPPRRNTALIGGIVVVCTMLVLGSILLVAFMVNRDDGGSDGAADEHTGAETVDDESAEGDNGDDGGEEGDDGDSTDDGTGGDHLGDDPGAVAVAISEILMGMSDQSSQGLVCSNPSIYLLDPELVGETAAETLGELYSLLDEFAVGETTETAEGVTVEVLVVMLGTESPFATVDLVQEDGSWKACDFVPHEDY